MTPEKPRCIPITDKEELTKREADLLKFGASFFGDFQYRYRDGKRIERRQRYGSEWDIVDENILLSMGPDELRHIINIMNK